MADPTNSGIVDELRMRTQLNVRQFLAGPRMIDRALSTYYGCSAALEAPQDVVRPDTLAADTAPPGRRSVSIAAELAREGITPYPATPTATRIFEERPSISSRGPRDDEIDALQARLANLEALVERDEDVLRKLLALFIEKGLATRDEILDRIR